MSAFQTRRPSATRACEGRCEQAQHVDVHGRLGQHNVSGGHGKAVHVAGPLRGHLAQERAGDRGGVSGSRCAELSDGGGSVEGRVVYDVGGLRAKPHANIVPAAHSAFAAVGCRRRTHALLAVVS